MEWALILILQNGVIWDSELRYPNVYECQKARNQAGTEMSSAKTKHEKDQINIPLGLSGENRDYQYIGQYEDDLDMLKQMRCLPLLNQES